jgi:predicted transcriptional regulator
MLADGRGGHVTVRPALSRKEPEVTGHGPAIDITTLRLDQPGIRAALGDLETEIMERVWQRPSDEPVTVRAIWEELYPARPIMYTTVMNTMTRLARKGLLVAEKAGKAFVYRRTLSREAFVDRFVGEALERLLVNFGGATRAHLEQVSDPARQERLGRLLGDLEQRRTVEEGED